MTNPEGWAPRRGTRPFRRIAIASDGSVPAEHAGAVAVGLATAFRAHLIVLCVIPFYPERSLHAFSGRASIAMAEPNDEEVRYFSSVASRFAEFARSRGVGSVATQVLTGHPGAKILAESKARRADLVVVGARGLSPSRRLLLGSVSTTVATGTSVPVLVVRGGAAKATASGAPPVTGIVAAIDGSSGSDRALEIAIAVSRALAVPLRIVTAVAPAARRVLGKEGARMEQEERLLLAQALVGTGRARAAAQGVSDVSATVLHGSPVDAILDCLGRDPTVLLVVGSRGRSSATRLLLGSVSVSLLHQAASMVMVVPSARTVHRARRSPRP